MKSHASLAAAFFACLSMAGAQTHPLNTKAATLRFEHACEPGPGVLQWREAVRESVLQNTPRPEPLPVFRYLVHYAGGATLPVVVRWSESVEAPVRRLFEPVSRFIGPMAWADVAWRGPVDAATETRPVRYAMRWPNPWPDCLIESVEVGEIPGAGKPLVHSVTPLDEPAPGRSFYVSPEGDDANPGTFEKPWAGPHKAAAAAGAGDTVFFREGTYAVDKPVVLGRSGTSNAWITFCNYPGESAVFNGRALATARKQNEFVVDWNGKPTALIASRTGVIHILSASFVRVLGLAVQDSAFAGICVNAAPWWKIEGIAQPEIPGCGHIDILHNRVQRTSNVGLGVYGAIIPNYTSLTNVRAIGNLVLRAHDKETFLLGADEAQNKARAEIRRRGKSRWGDENLDFHAVQQLEVAFNEVAFGGKEGVDLMNGTRHARVHHNYVHDQFFTALSGGTLGIYMDCRSEQWDLEVFHNVCERNGVGIQANSEDGAPARGIRIHHNLCKDNYWTGIAVLMWNEDGKEFRDVAVENNIVFRNGFLESNKAPAGGIHIHALTPLLRDILVRGNVVAANRDYQLAHHEADLKAQNILFDRNHIWPAELKAFDDPRWKKKWVPTHGANPVLAEPRFPAPDEHRFGLWME